MKIAILGTRGIPNHYGGFEQFAQNLSLGLVRHRHEVTVYNSHNHCYKEKTWNSVNIVHCYDPEYLLGTTGQFIYDLNCILDCRKRDFDVILELGYTSSSIWFKKLLKNSKFVVTTNMDGHEWKRSKYSKWVRRFLKYAEKIAVKHGGHLIADSLPIKEYLQSKYNADSTYIPYGAEIFDTPDPAVPERYDLTPYQYDMLVARLEAENSIEIILDGVVQATTPQPFLVVGNCHTAYGRYLQEKFRKHQNIRFLNGIYDLGVLNNLRYYSRVYFHGHTVGGTNPSLLEAMASSALICAHDNVYNASILGGNAFYFYGADQITAVLDSVARHDEENKVKVSGNLESIGCRYTWDRIIGEYIQHFERISGVEMNADIKAFQWNRILEPHRESEPHLHDPLEEEVAAGS